MIRPIYEFFIPLFAGHVLGDFIIQSDEDVKNKKQKRVLLKHSFIIGFISYALIGIVQAWFIGLIIFISHAIIDYVKSKSSKDNLRIFLYDQFAHLVVILVISLVLTSQGLYPYSSLWLRYMGKSFYSLALIIAGAIVCVNVGGIVVGLCVKPFIDQLEKITNSSSNASSESPGNQARGFKDGGKIIGYLERALIYLFVLANQPTAIGFLIAAKSVFRFGELKESAKRMEAEYIIIGTLYSFLFGLLVSYLTKEILSII